MSEATTDIPTFWYTEEEYERVLNRLIAERADHARHRREDAEEIKAWQGIAKQFEVELAIAKANIPLPDPNQQHEEEEKE